MSDNNIFSQLSYQSMNTLFSLANFGNEHIFWVRSPDFTKQLFLSKSYETIWGRKRQQLYDQPLSFKDSLITQECKVIMSLMGKRFAVNGADGEESTLAFRILTPDSTIKYIIDQSFNLYGKNGLLIAKAGFAKTLSRREWQEITDMGAKPLQKKTIIDNMPLFDILQKELGVSPQKSRANQFMLISHQHSIRLSAREAECVQHLMYGKPIKVIARDLRLSPRTVESYLNTVKMKLNTKSLLELVCKIDNKDMVLSWRFRQAEPQNVSISYT